MCRWVFVSVSCAQGAPPASSPRPPVQLAVLGTAAPTTQDARPLIKGAASTSKLRLPTCGIISNVPTVCGADQSREAEVSGPGRDLPRYPVRCLVRPPHKAPGALQGTSKALVAIFPEEVPGDQHDAAASVVGDRQWVGPFEQSRRD